VRSGPEVFPFCSGLKVWPGVAHSHASSLSPVTGFARLIAGFRVSRFAPVWAAVCAQVRRGIFTALARFCEFRCRVSHRPEFHLALDACHWSFFPRVKSSFSSTFSYLRWSPSLPHCVGQDLHRCRSRIQFLGPVFVSCAYHLPSHCADRSRRPILNLQSQYQTPLPRCLRSSHVSLLCFD
jgi:hypothetical protein